MLGKILRCAPSPPRANALRRLRSSAHTGALALRSRDTLNNLITKSPQSWQTSVALPFFNIQGTVIEWDECAAALAAAPFARLAAASLTAAPRARRIRFDVRLMQRVPYEGVSRMQTSLRRRHRDRVVRRGLGLVIESDVRRRPRPRSHLRLPRSCLSVGLLRRSSTRPTPAARTSPTSSRASGEPCPHPRPHPLCRHRDAVRYSPRPCSVLRSYCVQEARSLPPARRPARSSRVLSFVHRPATSTCSTPTSRAAVSRLPLAR